MKEIFEFLQELKNKTVIVEGKKDKKALEHFGIKNIIVLNKPLPVIVETSEIATRNLPASARSKRAISECAQEHAPGFSPAVLDIVANNYDECAILTDLDRQGKKLYAVLSKGLRSFGIKIDDRLRNYLYSHTKLTQIEGLIHYLSKVNKI